MVNDTGSGRVSLGRDLQKKFGSMSIPLSSVRRPCRDLVSRPRWPEHQTRTTEGETAMATMTRTIGTVSNARGTVNKTNVALWITQGALALVFLGAGSMNLMMSAENFASQSPMHFPMWFIRFI